MREEVRAFNIIFRQIYMAQALNQFFIFFRESD